MKVSPAQSQHEELALTKTCLAVNLLCTIRVELIVRFEDLPRYISPGNVSFRMVTVDMVMSPNGNTLDFDVYFQDQRLEKVSPRFIQCI
jgi:hypothetical protein